MNTTNDGSNFGGSTFITFPPVGSSGVSHPHETVPFENELFVPDLVSLKSPFAVQISNGSLFREVIPSGGLSPTKTVFSRSEERLNSLPEVVHATPQFITIFWSRFMKLQAPSQPSGSHLWTKTPQISSPTFRSSRRTNLLSRELAISPRKS